MKKIKEEKRGSVIVKTSIIGIFVNLLLVVFKVIIGLISNSIAIILDAVNNLSDALSSIVTIISTKIADSEPDKEHPLGHGRIEYLSAMIVAGIIFYAGITSLIESIKKIFNPEEVNYSNITFIILVVSILLKLLLGKYVKNIGEKLMANFTNIEKSCIINEGKEKNIFAFKNFELEIILETETDRKVKVQKKINKIFK